ncbi:MAG: FecR family protein [Opitutae bacterium]
MGGAIVVDFSGDIQIKAPTTEGTEERYGPDWEEPQKEQILTAGYGLRTRANSNIRLLLTNGTLITLSPESQAKILTYFQEPITASDRTFEQTTAEISPSMVKLELSMGEMIVETKKLNKSSSFDIHSPVAVAGIRGTAFRLRADDNGQALDVIRGQVDCQQGRGRVTSVIGGQANTATKGRISDPEDIAADAGSQIEKVCASLGKEVGGRTVSELSQAHNSANPPMDIEIGPEGFEAALRAKIRRPRGEILQQDYDRVGSINSINWITGANIKDIRFVQKLRNLKQVTFVAQPISDLSPLSTCTQLWLVDLDNLRKVTSIKPLEGMTNLESLRLTGDMAALRKPELTLSKLLSLKTLRVSVIGLNYSNFISDLNQLNKLTVSPTADFAAIAKQKNIKSLEVVFSPETIDRMPKLEIFSNFSHLERLKFRFHQCEKTFTEGEINQLKNFLPNVEVIVSE